LEEAKKKGYGILGKYKEGVVLLLETLRQLRKALHQL
jgi:hypothetical protein